MPDFSGPEQVTSEYEQGKSALAALSLTSRDMRSISQPVLFHCFYDNPYQNKTSKFLRTLISQPQLASCVRVLALPGRRKVQELEYNTRYELKTWNEIGTRMNIPSPKWITRILAEEPVSGVLEAMLAFGPFPALESEEVVLVAFDGAGQDSRLRFHWLGTELFGDLRFWQQFLLVALCSANLTHLAISGIYAPRLGQCYGRVLTDCLGPSQHLEQPFDFPNLQLISFQMASSFSGDFTSFFSQAPLLNHVAFGRIYGHPFAVAGLTLGAPLDNVHTLSLTCDPHHLRDILRLCDQVQDLEFYLDAPLPSFSSAAPSPVPDPWPATIKRNVRRLCWSMNDRQSPRMLQNEGKALFPPLREFPNLEILEIDRRALQIGLTTTLAIDPNTPQEVSQRLPEILPASIRILHFSYSMDSVFPVLSWSLLVAELEALAAAKPFLPILSVIQVDEYKPGTIYGKPLPQVMETLGVVSAMADAGIQLKFGLDPRNTGPLARGMCSPLPGNLEEISEHIAIYPPAENFFLQD